MSLFVGNLHPDCTEAMLFRKFSPVGKILNIHICRKNNKKQSLSYGFINFADKETADKVLETMNYELINGLPIRLMQVKPHSGVCNPSANIFIKNLHDSIDERILNDIFSSFGSIISAKIVTDVNGKSKGIGYVQFEEESSADAAIKGIDTKLIKGLQVSVCKFLAKSKRHKEFNNIYLKPLRPSFTDEDLKELCQKFGSITSAKVMKDEEGLSKGFGFVCFQKAWAAEDAVDELNGTLLYGKTLFVGRAKTKAERQNEILEKFWKKLESCTM